MLKKGLKIDRNSFKNLSKPDKTIRSNLFTIRIFKTDDYFSKFSISVSRKVQKKAALRNRMRRIAYDFIRKNWLEAMMETKNGNAIHIIFNKMPKDVKNDILEDLKSIHFK